MRQSQGEDGGEGRGRRGTGAQKEIGPAKPPMDLRLYPTERLREARLFPEAGELRDYHHTTPSRYYTRAAGLLNPLDPSLAPIVPSLLHLPLTYCVHSGAEEEKLKQSWSPARLLNLLCSVGGKGEE